MSGYRGRVALPSRRHERAGLWWGLLLALVTGVLLVLEQQRRQGAEHVAREDAALAAVKSLIAAEQTHRASAGRFAWLEELGATLPVATKAGPQGLEGRSPGYRLDVLLPSGRGAGGEILLVTRGGATDPLLAARHLAVVARPLVPGESGWRIFYADETGRVFVQEGAIDAEGSRENLLPRARLERPRSANEPGAVWRLLDDLDKNP